MTSDVLPPRSDRRNSGLLGLRTSGVTTIPRNAYCLVTLVLLIATALYLITEIAFTSYLIEFLGAPRSSTEILEIEHVGRRLTGIALALVLFPVVINRTVRMFGFSRQTLALIVFVMLPATTFASYHLVAWGIEEIVVLLTDGTTLTSRQNALLVSAIVAELHQANGSLPVMTLNGEFVPDALNQSVERKIVLAALPFLISSVPEMREKMMAALEVTVRNSTRQSIGGDEKAYNDLFVQPMKDLVAPTYDGFIKAVNAYRTARYERVRRADQEFDRYREELASKHLTIDLAKRSKRVMDAVAKRVIADNPRFKPICDRKGIPDSVSDFDQVIEETIEDDYADAARKLDLAGLRPPSGEFDPAHFVALPETKTLWHRRVGELVKNEALARRLSEFGPQVGHDDAMFDKFRSEVLRPYLEEEVAARMKDVSAQVDSYVSGSEVAEHAYSAAKSIIVIPIAIIFSMIGALTHFTKIGVLGLQLLGLGFFKGFIICAAVTSTVVTVLTKGYRDEMLEWKAAAPIVAGLRSSFGECGATGFRTTVAVQSRLYPIGFTARKRLPALEHLFPFQLKAERQN